MNPEIEKLIDIAAKQGNVTPRQIEIVRKKAIELNLDPDEAETILTLTVKKNMKSPVENFVQRNSDLNDNANSSIQSNITKLINENHVATELPHNNDTSNGKNMLVAFVLAIFLGWMGIHKFYLGETKSGILYLIFFWTGIPYILAIVDAIKYLLKSTPYFRKL